MAVDPDVIRSPTRWVSRFRHPKRTARRVAERVWRHAPTLFLASASAGIAYVVARLVFGNEQAVFAPIAAIVSMGLTAGQRLTRAFEITLGVILGLVAADVLSRWVGIGAWQLTLAVLIAMVCAVAFRASGLLVNQAAVAAVVVMALVPFQDVGLFVRLGDAVIGGAVSLTLNAFLSPDPRRGAVTAADQAIQRYVRALRRLERALETRDPRPAEQAMMDLEDLGSVRQEITETLAATRERISLYRAANRLEQRRRLRAVEQLNARMDLLLTSGRSMARTTAAVVRHGGEPDAHLVEGIAQLAETMGALAEWVRGKTRPNVVRDMALSAAVTVSQTLGAHHPPASNVLAWQVRSAVVDVLRVLGLTHRSALAALEQAAGRADRTARRTGTQRDQHH